MSYYMSGLNAAMRRVDFPRDVTFTENEVYTKLRLNLFPRGTRLYEPWFWQRWFRRYTWAHASLSYGTASLYIPIRIGFNWRFIGNAVVFQPFVGSSSAGSVEDISEIVRALVGTIPSPVKLRERVVKLPVPEWYGVQPTHGEVYADSLWGFEGEAQESMDRLRADFKQALAIARRQKASHVKMPDPEWGYIVENGFPVIYKDGLIPLTEAEAAWRAFEAQAGAAWNEQLNVRL